MNLKKLIVRMVVAATLGLVAGLIMERLASWKAFPEFLIWGFLGGICAGIVIEVLSCDYSITRDDLRKAEKPVLRILVVMAIGLFVGAVFEYFAVGALYPLFLIWGGLIGLFIGITIELIRYRHVIGRILREGEGLDLEGLPVNTAEFIRRVIRKMRYLKKIRSEVAAELAAHFEDELKDCTTDERRREKAQQLINDFGDVKLLAVLLRRAKKRCRPLWRIVVARTFQAVGVLILCFIVYVVWFLTGKPTITTNYVAEFNQIVRPTADESLNAAPLYLKAVDLHIELSDDFLLFFVKNHQAIVDEKFPRKFELLADKIDRVVSNKKLWNYHDKRQDVQEEVCGIFYKFLEKKYNELAAEQKNIAQRWVQEQNDALELIIEGSRRPYYWRTYESGSENPAEMLGVLLPNLQVFRNLARSLRWRAWLRAGQGRFEDSFADMKSCYRLGQHTRGDKTLIEQLVGIAIEALAVQTIRDIVSEYEVDSMILADLQDSFQQIFADENFVISLKAEKLCMYDEIQRCFTSDGIGKGHLYLPRFRKMADLAGSHKKGEGFEYFVLDLVYSSPFLFTHPNKEETLQMANEFYDYCEELSLKTAVQRHAESDAIDNNLEELLSGNIFLGTVTPAVRWIIEIGNRLPTEVGATLTIIAIFRYKSDSGQYPQNR
jgi:hypothetical protein